MSECRGKNEELSGAEWDKMLSSDDDAIIQSIKAEKEDEEVAAAAATVTGDDNFFSILTNYLDEEDEEVEETAKEAGMICQRFKAEKEAEKAVIKAEKDAIKDAIKVEKEDEEAEKDLGFCEERRRLCKEFNMSRWVPFHEAVLAIPLQPSRQPGKILEKHWKKGFLKVLQQVHPGMEVEDNALYVIQDYCASLADSLIYTCLNDPEVWTIDPEVKENGLISSLHLQTAIPLVLKAELYKHCLSECIKATAHSGSNLVFSTQECNSAADRVTDGCYKIVSEGTTFQGSGAIYLACALEYISAEILELSGYKCSERGSAKISCEDVELAIAGDEELLFTRGTMASIKDTIHIRRTKDERWERRKNWMVAIAPYLRGEVTDAPIQAIFDILSITRLITSFI